MATSCMVKSGGGQCGGFNFVAMTKAHLLQDCYTPTKSDDTN